MEEKKMYSGDWHCQDCGAAIDALPFEPKDASTISCRECHSKKASAQVRIQKVYCGDWSCCECGATIDELPFKPLDPDTVACRDCHRKNLS